MEKNSKLENLLEENSFKKISKEENLKEENSLKKHLTTGVIVGGAVVAVVATAPILYGFGLAGVVAGSAAATAQSGMAGGAVAAGSWFATCTSLGMKGYFASSAIGGAVTATTGAVVKYKDCVLNYFKSNKDKKE